MEDRDLRQRLSLSARSRFINEFGPHVVARKFAACLRAAADRMAGTMTAPAPMADRLVASS
jgi:hypothetical protein